MEDFQHIVYSREVVGFVAIAKEYCAFIENAASMEKVDFLARLQRFIPLIYLKGSLLPSCEAVGGNIAVDAMSEEEYNSTYFTIRQLLGEDDDYLEVFDDQMQFREEPVVHSMAEKSCDIYQDLKNFLLAYQHGLTEVMEEALWVLNENFELYWGKSCAGVLRAVHAAVYRGADSKD